MAADQKDSPSPKQSPSKVYSPPRDRPSSTDSDFSKLGWDGPGKKALGDDRGIKEAPSD